MSWVCQFICLSAFAAHAIAAPQKLRRSQPLPDFALTYSPYSYIYSGEQWFPSDISVHLQNTIPEANFVATGAPGTVNVNNLNTYNSSIYLTSNDNPDNKPAWILSTYGKPDSNGYSAAPGTIIAVQKNETWVDVFYFYFYSYNYGGKVLGINFDDHVGDWEHTMIRFINGKPYAIYLSEHGAGSAYYWNILQFKGSKPVTYIASGGHANYATAGKQDYTIALGLISDTTDAGFGWDMSQNFRGYWYNNATGEFSIASGASTGADEEANETASWLSWLGSWGDQQYPNSHSGQYCIFGECHYVSGPTGPVAKNLGRNAMCQNENSCSIFDNLNDVTIQTKRADTLFREELEALGDESQ